VTASAPVDFRSAARAWIEEDPDPETVAELEALLASGVDAELADRFSTRLAFGTAGLRGEMGAGPNRMNRVTVRYAAAGLARVVASQGGAAREAGVVIGFDARRNSAAFASDTAAVLAGAGVRAMVLPRPLPTPVLAFAVRHLSAAAGVMVTASHNPAGDNGYKVYWADGAQIVPPIDEDIAAAIDAITSLREVALAPDDDPRIERLDDSIVEAYVAMAAATPHASLPVVGEQVIAAYTPLHGVGRDVFLRVVAATGLRQPVVVETQADPDPDFPTVAFPNPEEPGAMDAVVDLARDAGATLAVANDPDADRVAIAIPDGDGGEWRRLTGDEVGWLLADHLLREVGPPAGDDRPSLVATTIVSSRLLEVIAAANGARYEETLTGFKWLARPALARPDLRSVLAYEEALGYAVGGQLDKDGITAAVVLVALANALAQQGETLADRLSQLAERYGSHATGQWSLRRDGPGGLERLRAVMVRLRRALPDEVAGHAVLEARDLLTDEGRGSLPATDAVVLTLDGGHRVVVRPSGTEPKAKVYVEAVGATADGATRELRGLLDAMRVLLDDEEES